ncbi:hypothetical protein [Bradyrhizobium sp. B120]|uniref:hypothetical protein n=1 Tax=Bradyrhizobium sp. B120 TaxID=3410088 RepID=UPI003B984097
MEAGYNDPNYWMRWYAEQQELQRARQEADLEPADQTGFEQQLGELQLRSPEESSPEVSSPDSPAAARSHENVQRTDVGGSMRMPPRSNLWDSSFNSTRYSVDVPPAHLSSAANDYRSDLRGSPISSMRYAAPSEAQSTARTKDNKPRGLFSRVKSRLGKVFGGDRREKSYGGSSSEAVYSELRMDFAKRSRPSEAGPRQEEESVVNTEVRGRRAERDGFEPHAEDAVLMHGFTIAARTAGMPSGTIHGSRANLRHLSGWLRENNRAPIAGRLDQHSSGQGSLVTDVRDYLRAGGRPAVVAQLNRFAPGSLPPPSELGLDLADEDADLLARFRATGQGGSSKATVNKAYYGLRDLARWLHINNKSPLASQLRDDKLAPDLEEYRSSGKDPEKRLTSALNHLQQLASADEAGTAPLVPARHTRIPYPEDAPLIDGALKHAMDGASTARQRKDHQNRASRFRDFSAWLRTQNKQSIAGRLNGTPQDDALLQKDLAAFRRAGGKVYGPDFSHLQDYLHDVQADQAGMQPEASVAQDTGRQPGSPQQLPATPATPSAGAWNWLSEQFHGPASPVPVPHWAPQPNLPLGHPATPASPSQGAWDWLGQQMQEPASPSSVRAPSSNIYGGRDSLLNPPTHDLRDDAHSAPAPQFAGMPSFAGPSGPAQELRDIGAIVGADWRHGSQAASGVLVDVLGNINLLPSPFAPSQFTINGERYSAAFTPGGWRDVFLIHHPHARQSSEPGPSQPIHQPSLIVGAETREAVVDLGPLIRGGWEHRERFLPAYLVPALESHRIMPEVGRPTHFDIHGVPYRAELVESEGRQRVRIYPQFG